MALWGRLDAMRRRLRCRSTHLAVEQLEARNVPGFLTGINYDVDQYPSAVVVADFNQDGIPDMVVGSYTLSSISMLLGNADGTFQTARLIGRGFGPSSLAVGDVNG